MPSQQPPGLYLIRWCAVPVLGKPPLDMVYVTLPPRLIGAVSYPGCIGTPDAKATTRRYALTCIQVLDRTNKPRQSAKTVPGSCRSKRTLTGFGGFTLWPSKPCVGPKVRLYRLVFSVLITRGPLVDTRTGSTDRQSAQC